MVSSVHMFIFPIIYSAKLEGRLQQTVTIQIGNSIYGTSYINEFPLVLWWKKCVLKQKLRGKKLTSEHIGCEHISTISVA